MWRGVNEAVVMNRVLSGKLPELLAISPSTPTRLARMVARATALAPGDRYDGAAEFQEDIDRYLADEALEPRARELGEAVAKLFTDRRQERQTIVERELQRVADQSDDEYAGYQPVALTALEVHAENATKLQRRRKRERLRGAVPWLVAMMLAGALLMALFRLSSPQGEQVGVRDSSVVPSVRSIATEVATEAAIARLGITAFPRSARIELDGEPLPENPFRGTFPLDRERVHAVEVTASGHDAQLRSVRFDRDQELVITLSPVGRATERHASPPKKRTKVPESAGSSPPAVSAAAPANECDPPYFFDDRGVKKFKARCL